MEKPRVVEPFPKGNGASAMEVLGSAKDLAGQSAQDWADGQGAKAKQAAGDWAKQQGEKVKKACGDFDAASGSFKKKVDDYLHQKAKSAALDERDELAAELGPEPSAQAPRPKSKSLRKP